MNNTAKQIYTWVMREKLTAQHLGNKLREESEQPGLPPKKQQECVRKAADQKLRFQMLEELMREVEAQQVPQQQSFNPEYY